MGGGRGLFVVYYYHDQGVGFNSVSGCYDLCSTGYIEIKVWVYLKVQMFTRAKLFNMGQNILEVNLLVWGVLYCCCISKVVYGWGKFWHVGGIYSGKLFHNTKTFT